MRSWLLGVWGACAWSLLGCGGSSSVDFFNGPSQAAQSGGGAPSGTKACSPAKDVTGGMSGPFGSTEAACFRVTGAIAGWGCSNFDGRSIVVNGEAVSCGELPLPEPIDGAYYFQISAGMFDYASFYWY